MKFGVREICDVVLRAKATQKVGNKIFYRNEPVIYFDTLKTSTMEGAATTVYAQGGRGNSRLVAWEGERTITFTMEDALISPEGFMILSGAGLVEATEGKTIKQHITETIDGASKKIDVTNIAQDEITICVKQKPYLGEVVNDAWIPAGENFAYVMFVKDDVIITEPFIPSQDAEPVEIADPEDPSKKVYQITVKAHKAYDALTSKEKADGKAHGDDSYLPADLSDLVSDEKVKLFDSVIIDYYTERKAGAQQIEITADKFGGNYYLEASTLFRTTNGVDMPAEFIIPNCKIQSNFTFTMASSGDPSTFTFTMDAFPDYTRFDHSKKVLAAIQIIEDAGSMDLHRHSTEHEVEHESFFI